jgi:hypothetical protein
MRKGDLEKQKACEVIEEDDDDDEQETMGAMAGRCCSWFIINHIDIQVFFLSLLVLYLSVNRCCYCVFMVAVVSGTLCMRFRILNATLWSALIVLYMHKDWDLSFGAVRVSWNRAS